MPPKAPVTVTLKATTSQDKDTNMVESNKPQDLQIVTIKELREIVNYINNNMQVLNNKVNGIGITRVKLLSIERFNGTRSKLKGFFL